MQHAARYMIHDCNQTNRPTLKHGEEEARSQQGKIEEGS